MASIRKSLGNDALGRSQVDLRSHSYAGGGISRSKSFVSLLGSNRSTTKLKDSNRTSWYGRPLSQATNMGSVRSINSQMSMSTMPRVSTLGRPSTGSKVKAPRPQQCMAMFDALMGALREGVGITQSDIVDLKVNLDNAVASSGAGQGKAYDLEKQLRSAERYLHRLEYQVSIIEELQESYHVQGRMRDGVRTIARAYADSPGKEKESTFVNVHQGFQECTSSMSTIESQFESLLGAFQIQLKGLQGFARLCPGDVFEITLRHGSQKWKSKGRVAKDSSQSWESTNITFRPILDEVLIIRAVELRSFGKQVVLGNKFCEVLDLFCAQPQVMSVNLNASGSLKLHLMITWDPLDGCDEGMALRHQVSSPSLSRKVSMVSKNYHPSSASVSRTPSMSQRPSHSDPTPVPPLPEEEEAPESSIASNPSLLPVSRREDRNPEKLDVEVPSGIESRRESRIFEKRDVDLDFLENVSSRVESRRESRLSENLGNRDIDLDIFEKVSSRIESESRATDSTGNFSFAKRSETEDKWWSPTHTMDSGYSGSLNGKKGKQLFPSVFLVPEENQPDSLISDVVDSFDSEFSEVTLSGVIKQVTSAVDDIRGRYPELELFEKNVAVLSQLVKRDMSRPESQMSTSSSAVVSALEAFDFLNLEEDAENNESRTLLSPVERQMRARKVAGSDSGSNSEQTSRSSSATRNMTASPSLSAISVCTTGNDQLDLVLKVHLEYSKELLERLGVYGPLNSRENEAIYQLHQQGKILSKIVKNIKSLQKTDGAVSGIVELDPYKHLQSLWERLSPEGRDLCITADQMAHSLLPICTALLEARSEEFCERVLKDLVCSCQCSEVFRPETFVTVYQFRQYIRTKERSFVTRLEELSDELFITDSLSSVDSAGQLKKLLNRLSLPIILPTRNIVLAVGRLATSSQDPETKRLVREFLESRLRLPQHSEIYQKAFVHALESRDAKNRASACEALGFMHVYSAFDHLEFVAETDKDDFVRTAATKALQMISHQSSYEAEA